MTLKCNQTAVIVKKFYLSILIIIIGCQENDVPITISDIPEISFKEIEFIEGQTVFDQDTLRLTLLFQDGDGDLGLRPDGVDTEDPYHDNWFYTKSDGTFVTLADRSLPGFDTLLPPYEFPYTCINYSETNETDTFYTEANEFHYNIHVKYYVKENGIFTEFDWLTAFSPNCGDRFYYYGRFPVIWVNPSSPITSPIVIGDDSFKITVTSPYSGELEYYMKSAVFQLLFRGKTIKLKVKIYDRSLNSSNWIETPPFTF